MQRRHSMRNLAARGGVAAVAGAMMTTGLYPLAVHAYRAAAKHDGGTHPLRAALGEWAMSAAVSALRPAGFWPLPGAQTHARAP